MKQKQILIISIIVILAILACLTTFLIVNSNQGDYTTLRVSNSCTIDVPNVNNTMEHMSGGISKYLFSSVDLNITHQKSENNTQLKSINNESLKNSQKVDNDIYRDNTTGVYSTFIENKNTGDALLITSSNLDLLKKVKNNIKFTQTITSNNNTNKTNNTTDNPSTTGINELINKYNNAARPQQSSNQSGNNPDTTPASSDSSSSEPSQESKYPSYIPYNN